MAEQKESTKAKSTVVTSPITTSRHHSIASQNTQDGAKLPMEAKEREEILNQLARMIDVMHNWPMKIEGKMPKPYIAGGHVFFAFPVGGHVIQNSVTSEGTVNFFVDGVPVTSEAK
jgi:hypothetical protein